MPREKHRRLHFPGAEVASEADNASNNAVDLGAVWVWPGQQPEMLALLSSLGLKTFAQPGMGEGEGEVEQQQQQQQQHGSGGGFADVDNPDDDDDDDDDEGGGGGGHTKGRRHDDATVRVAGGAYAIVERLLERLPPAVPRLGWQLGSVTDERDPASRTGPMLLRPIQANTGPDDFDGCCSNNASSSAPRAVRATRAVILAVPPKVRTNERTNPRTHEPRGLFVICNLFICVARRLIPSPLLPTFTKQQITTTQCAHQLLCGGRVQFSPPLRRERCVAMGASRMDIGGDQGGPLVPRREVLAPFGGQRRAPTVPLRAPGDGGGRRRRRRRRRRRWRRGRQSVQAARRRRRRRRRRRPRPGGVEGFATTRS